MEVGGRTPEQGEQTVPPILGLRATDFSEFHSNRSSESAESAGSELSSRMKVIREITGARCPSFVLDFRETSGKGVGCRNSRVERG